MSNETTQAGLPDENKLPTASEIYDKMVSNDLPRFHTAIEYRRFAIDTAEQYTQSLLDQKDKEIIQLRKDMNEMADIQSAERLKWHNEIEQKEKEIKRCKLPVHGRLHNP